MDKIKFKNSKGLLTISIIGILFFIIAFLYTSRFGHEARGSVFAISNEAKKTYSHADAAKYCFNLSSVPAVAIDRNSSTIYTDWRLPTVEEASVFEGTITNNDYVWTTSMYNSEYYIGWTIYNFSDGSWGGGMRDQHLHVRCVR